jgi:hypothetical protein
MPNPSTPETPGSIIKQWGYCPYCLCVKDSRTSVRARYITDDGKLYITEADNPLYPIHLLKWVEDHSLETEINFMINAYDGAFIPVAVVKGTPVCGVHLWSTVYA